MNQQGLNTAIIRIEANVWIGALAVILSGVTIDSGTGIGACAVITQSVEALIEVGSVPARVIGQT